MKTSATLEETNLTCKCKYTSLQDPEIEQKAKMKMWQWHPVKKHNNMFVWNSLDTPIVKIFFLFLFLYIFSTGAKSLDGRNTCKDFALPANIWTGRVHRGGRGLIPDEKKKRWNTRFCLFFKDCKNFFITNIGRTFQE